MDRHSLVADRIGVGIDDRWLWRDLSFAVGRNTAIVGPSGSGKSVLMKTLAGLQPVTEGEIRYNGTRLASLPMPRFRSRVLYVPQSPAMLEGSVRDNLVAVLDFKSHRGRIYDEAEIIEQLAGFGRPKSFLQKSAADLSGGERQIVAFFRAQQLRPDMLLLDEPTANLDPIAARQLQKTLDDWLETGRLNAVVWTSHRRDAFERPYDEVIELDELERTSYA